LLAAWAKGQNTDGVHGISSVRNVAGNLSTPWLLVAFFAGAQCSRPRRGMLFGLLATVSALAGFYLLTTLVVNLGGHGFVGDLRLELRGNRVYFEAGVVTGPLFGALGAWWQRRRTTPAALLVGALLIAEPVVMAAVGAANSGWGLSADSGTSEWSVYALEFGIGVGLLVLAVRRRRQRNPHTT
jgi:hypothetical protein